MNRHTPDSAQVRVLVFREGVLSDFGYDLRLRVTRFDIEEDTEPVALRARFDPTSLQLEAALRGGRELGPLSASDRSEIERKAQQVLRPDLFPELRFVSTALDAASVAGQLTLHGVTREVRFPWKREGGARLAEVRLDQRAFGITPFRAMMGALKVRPEVVVQVRLPG